jgi:hypothetical protein
VDRLVCSTGKTDTIIQRLGDAIVPNAPLPQTTGVDVELVALQLDHGSADLGIGLDFCNAAERSWRSVQLWVIPSPSAMQMAGYRIHSSTSS